MSLIKCPECGKEISSQAFACPNCGFPMNKYQKDNVEQPVGNYLVLYTFTMQQSIAKHIWTFIIIEIIISGLIGASFIGFNLYVIIGVSIYCAIVEGLGVGGMIHGIVTTKRLNRLSGNKLEFNEEEKSLLFTDVSNLKHNIPIQNIIQFDGPGTMVVTYNDPITNSRKKAIVGCTCKNDILALRNKLKELKENITEQ